MTVAGNPVKNPEARVESKRPSLATFDSRLATLKDAICEATALACEEAFGGRLRSVLLTGSLAREEATFVREGEAWSVLGDAEFLLIFHARATLPSNLSALREKIESALLESRVACRVSLGAVHPDYLLKMRPHIFGYELRTCGQVIWGDTAILSLVPPFSPSDIPLEDGWRLLANRMIEFLEAAGSADGLSSPSSVPYSVVKLYLDMGTSFLLFQGAYEPTYRRREARLRSLAESATNQAGFPFFPMRRFSELVTACTDFKLGTSGSNDGRVNRERIPTSTLSWEELSADVRALWRWELSHLVHAAGEDEDRRDAPCKHLEEYQRTGPSRDTSGPHDGDQRDCELLRKWIRVQPLGTRLRGWAFVVRRRRWHRSWREWPRWLRLGWQASPRYCLYAAASELFFKLGDLLPSGQTPSSAIVGSKGLASWLPIQATEDRGHGKGKSEQGATWQLLASAIAWNYHEFLEGTRA